MKKASLTKVSIIFVIIIMVAVIGMESLSDRSVSSASSCPQSFQLVQQMIKGGSSPSFKVIGREEASHYFDVVRHYAHTTYNSVAVVSGIYVVGDININRWIYYLKEGSIGIDSDDGYAKIIGQELDLEKLGGNFYFTTNPYDKK